jgi:oxygen-independent coproporphyrinogen-3 oxidase
MTGNIRKGMTGPLALYVHWPFCLSKCPYCDFNSHVAETIDRGAWRRAYLAEMDALAPSLGARHLTSIFFGGGTPSLMDADTVGAVIEKASTLWPPNDSDGFEITLEANPTSAEAQNFQAFRAAGVNRLSLGIQALDDQALGFLGRHHSADEALLALDLAQKHFARVNADMIYARPGQNVAAWRVELAPLMHRSLGHLSLYQLTIERGTPFFAAHRRGDFTLPDEDNQATLYETTGEMLGAAGLTAYEVSNYARPREACRHNVHIWRYGDFAGIGPGAHGRLTLDGAAFATENLRSPQDWLGAVEKTGQGLKAQTPLSQRTRAEEMVMMGLRLGAGIALEDFRAVTGADFSDILGGDRIARLVTGGFLTDETERLCATDEGRLRLDALIGNLLGGA